MSTDGLKTTNYPQHSNLLDFNITIDHSKEIIVGFVYTVYTPLLHLGIITKGLHLRPPTIPEPISTPRYVAWMQSNAMMKPPTQAGQ